MQLQNEQLNIRDLSRRRKHDATLHTFVRSRICPACEAEMATDDGEDVCQTCRQDSVGSVYAISSRSRASESNHTELQAICSDCCCIPFGDEVACESRDCPVFYSRLKAKSALQDALVQGTRVLEGKDNDYY
jgi:DNA polymerase zeta